MIPAEKQKEFDQLVKIVIDYNKTELGDLAAYIEQSSTIMPPFHNDFRNNRSEIYALFRSPENWERFEKRLLDMLNKTVWHQDSYPPEATSYLALRSSFIEELLKDKPTILTDIEVLTEHGFTEKEIWLALHDCYYGNYEYENKSVFSQYIVSNAPNYLSLSDLNFSNSEYFTKRLIANKPDFFDMYIHKFMQGSYEGKHFIVDISKVIKEYLLQNGDKHEAYLVSLLSFNDESNTVDYKITPYLLTDLLETNYPKKYDKEIEIYLKPIADKALKYPSQIWPNVFERTLDTLLRYDSAENAFGITSNYLRKFKDINPHNIKIWLKKLKQYDVTLI
jgi:hypothetical protein